MQSAFAKLWILFGLLALAPRASAQPVPEDFRRITDKVAHIVADHITGSRDKIIEDKAFQLSAH